MGAEVKTGGPAFPQSIREEDGSTTYYHGLSVRDYFAAKWMQGAAADITTRGWQDKAVEYARISYSVADAMLKAREQ